MRPVLTLTTDFGTHDPYVGIMKGVVLTICPAAQLVDMTHAIGPQDIAAAAFALPTYSDYFPAGTVHLVVVDPGVGSARQPLALETPHAYYVGPDNGIFSLVWRQAHARWPADAIRAVALTEPRFWRPGMEMPSATFHGRDIFAPVAAHLAAGTPLAALGPPLHTPVLLPMPEPTIEADEAQAASERAAAGQATSPRLRGQVMVIDHFGNCISNITAAHLDQVGPPDTLAVHVWTRRLPLLRTYADVARGRALALLGSEGYLELAIRDGSAAHALGITPGTAIQITTADAQEHARTNR